MILWCKILLWTTFAWKVLENLLQLMIIKNYFVDLKKDVFFYKKKAILKIKEKFCFKLKNMFFFAVVEKTVFLK